MSRIFLPPEKLTEKSILINGDQARHLALVLRTEPGDTVTVLDGNGFRYVCKVTGVHKREITAEIVRIEPYTTESHLAITLAQGVPKGDKMDLIVQKSTELGVHTIIPVITERSQVRSTEKTERWRKIARAAAQQSGRNRIPEVSVPTSLDTFLKNHKRVNGVILSEGEKTLSLKDTLSRFIGLSSLSVFVGPEGGYSSDELNQAARNGFVPVSLGPRILRTETAAIAAVTIVQNSLGDMGKSPVS